MDGMLRAISRAAGSMFGNILFGGGIGALIDHNKGAGYNYPDELPVQMGASVTVDRKDEDAVRLGRQVQPAQAVPTTSAPGNQAPLPCPTHIMSAQEKSRLGC